MCVMLIGVIPLITVIYSCVNNISVCARCASHSKLKGCEVFNLFKCFILSGINDEKGPRLHSKHKTFSTSVVWDLINHISLWILFNPDGWVMSDKRALFYHLDRYFFLYLIDWITFVWWEAGETTTDYNRKSGILKQRNSMNSMYRIISISQSILYRFLLYRRKLMTSQDLWGCDVVSDTRMLAGCDVLRVLIPLQCDQQWVFLQ